MKILWLVNIIMPELAEHLGGKPSVFGGWLTGALDTIRDSGHEIAICTTSRDKDVVGVYALKDATYIVLENGALDQMEQDFRLVLNREHPDVIHVFGTEFPHTLAMVRAADPARLMVTIQGPLELYKEKVFGGLPERVCRDNVLHKLLRRLHKGGQSIELQKISFDKRAELEVEALKQTKYIHGGSEWGNQVAQQIHPGCTTLDCGLTLREQFYTSRQWSNETCDKHTIYTLFSYPIKGFHQVLEAMPAILKQFPDTKIRVVSNKLTRREYRGVKRQIMDLAPDYQWYIQKRIDELGLWEHLIFQGSLNADQVRDKLLKSNVFVAAANIENQCTALGEALMLGVPSVATRAGAMPEYITDGESGLLYDFEDTKTLADHICRIFADADFAQTLSRNAPILPRALYSREENGKKLLEIYARIYRDSKEATT